MNIQREELNAMNRDDVATGKKLAPVHPGKILLRDFSRRRCERLQTVANRPISDCRHRPLSGNHLCDS